MSRILAESSSSTYVAMDTEFPGFLYRTPFGASEERRYRDMRRNVDAMKIIQLGLTFYDHEGVFKGSWEVNFREFDPAADPHESSVQLLLDSGMDFDENKRDGACASCFARSFYRRVLLPYRHRIKWITFHGLYDVGYAVKLLMGRPLPEGRRRFLCRVQNVLGSVYDVKYMMACRGFNQRMGLVKLAEELDVVGAAEGRNHQAGYDSLITALSFLKLRRDGMVEDKAAGIFYGLHRCGLRRMLGHYTCMSMTT
ncbi:uncharacterized protein A4U43_C05F34690 [Asparagus officinalis]|uniref:poly(A)-specific ribonuclease n=2 Tax=Asparagus officinalis TaxID=4686 RepID=A0A5P1EX91_ASPOF|nr:uncharacterized protein A4U43_C05F34690 [Asparagus officinalis]